MAYGSTLGKKLKDINQGDVQVPTKDGLAAFKIICSKLDELLGYAVANQVSTRTPSHSTDCSRKCSRSTSSSAGIIYE